ncbi:MAG TPA: insulinase family protein, partial [Thermodesulfobacteriota bacterium]|nr:insulinase family protein [Thermodesulfobacteriota bacterium]
TYIDSGLTVVYAGTSEDSFREVIDLVLREFNHLKKGLLKNGELETSKEQLKGNLLLSLESTDNLMTRLAKNEIYFQSYLPVNMILKGIDGVKEETVQQLANEIFDERLFCLTVLGPTHGDDLDRVRLTVE